MFVYGLEQVRFFYRIFIRVMYKSALFRANWGKRILDSTSYLIRSDLYATGAGEFTADRDTRGSAPFRANWNFGGKEFTKIFAV